jgi:hypothetical protein
MARETGLSVTHFTRLFSQQTGFAPMKHFIRLKMQRACHYLMLTPHSIKEIARREGLGCRRIQHGVARARERGNVSRIRRSRSSNQVHERNQNSIAGAGRAAGDDPNRPPRLFPLFPIGPFTPRSACPHHGPIRAGSVFCCMVCSRSGIDDHPALKRDPRTDPRPESKAAAAARVASVHETRRQRRQRLHAARQARLGTVASLAKDAPGPTSQSSIPSP